MRSPLAVLLAMALLALAPLTAPAPAPAAQLPDTPDPDEEPDEEPVDGQAADDPELPLTSLLPALPLPLLPLFQGTGDLVAVPCPGGEVACVDAVAEEMRVRLPGLLSTCDHDAAFALTYLHVTEEYRRTVADPGFFDDTPFVNRHATVFAEVYFNAYDAWHRGDVDEVPAAWETAFRAADEGRVSAVGNVLLGLSAHVNRDLPFVLAALGVRRPDGASRKPDHDLVNAILRAVSGPILAEIAERLDPAASTATIDGTELDETVLFQLLAVWREEAWRNAELLTAAGTPLLRATVARTIEITAAVKQQTLLTATRYRPPVTSPTARDTWCRTHG